MSNLVIYGPGWGGQPSRMALNPLLRRFKGMADTITIEYPSYGFNCITENADAAWEQLVKDVKKDYKNVVWIGHSMGGLVPFGNHKISDFIDSLVTLGTPWNGSIFAKLAPFSESAKKMITGCDYLEDSRIHAELWKKPKMTVSGAFDIIVPTGAHLEDSYKLQVANTHAGLIFSKKVYTTMMQWLGSQWK